jgi:eukaryotic-like serine/threonine-protein kinase
MELTQSNAIDQYEITKLIARSGMASIFKATDSASGAPVVLKIPHPQFEGDVVYFERFRREEGIGQRLDHPNIVRVLTPREKSSIYMVLEYIEGRSLRALMDESKPLPTRQAVAIAIQLVAALAHMHERRVVHRDLKPENILVAADGQVKVLDFGIALDRTARRITWHGMSSTMGTPDYIAPEQIVGNRGDERSDIYAIGTILFEMLTGQLPFLKANPHALMHAKISDQPKAPSYFVSGIDPSLETIVLRAIQCRPRDRYAAAAEMLADLENPAAVTPRTFEGGGLRRGLASRPFVMAIVIGVVLIALGVLAFATSRRAPAPHSRGLLIGDRSSTT